MRRSLAVFYADVGSATGIGHVMRCGALASALASRGRCNRLLLEPDRRSTLPSRLDFDSIDFDIAALAETPDLAVVDHYAPRSDWVDALEARSQRILEISDVATCPSGSRFLLNQNLDAVPKTQPEVPMAGRPVADGSRSFLGPDFALVRGAFARHRHKSRPSEERGEVRRALVMLGGTDVHALTEPVVDQLLRLGIEATAIVSSAASSVDRIRARIDKAAPGSRFVVDASADEIAMLMSEHDLLIGNAGGTSWERCTLGLPAVVLVMADNQERNASSLIKSGTAVDGGRPSDPTFLLTLGRIIGDLALDVPSLRRMSARSFRTCDGLGAFRVGLGLDPPRIRSGVAIDLRKVEAADCELLFRWQLAPLTRQFARNPLPPTLEGHRAWFEAKLADHRSIFSIIEVGGRAAGSLRLDYVETVDDDPTYEVSINVDPDRLGEGIGSAALQAVKWLTPFARRRAFVKPENAASMALFRGRGYVREGNYLFDGPVDG